MFDLIKQKLFNCKTNVDQAASGLDEECAQSKLRILVTAAIASYSLLLALIGWVSVNAWFIAILTLTFLFAGGWSYYLNHTNKKNPNAQLPNLNQLRFRRIAFSVLDIGLISSTLAALGPYGAVVYPMYLWVVVGNGIRYGITYTIVGIALTVLMFGSVLLFSPFWSQNHVIGISLLFGVFMLPPFYIKMIYRLHVLNGRLQTYAYETWYAATHDYLTGIYNRASFFEKLEHILSNEERHDFTVAFIDIDDFKSINDTYGHNFGDIVLNKIVHRIKTMVRNDDIIGRIGGDEIAIIFPNLENHSLIKEMGERLITYTAQEIKAEGYTVTPSVSIGMVKASSEDVCSDNLMAKADSMMYTAKEQGKNAYIIHDEG